MKKINNIALKAAVVLFGILGLCACRDDVQENGEGNLALKMSIAMPESIAPAGAPATQAATLADSCRVRIYGSKGLVRYYKGLENIPSQLWIAAGSYRIDALSGDSVPATWEIGYYKGSTQVEIKAGETAQVALACKIVNTLVTVDFTDALKAALTEYTVTVKSSTGSLVYTPAEVGKVGYFILPDGETTLNWVIDGTANDGSVYTQSGTLQNVKGATKYALTFNYNATEYTQGGAYFNLTVDETAVEKVDNIVIYKRPDIVGEGYDITLPLVFEVGAGTETSVLVNTSSALSQLVISGEALTAMGLPATSIDLYSATTETLAAWEAAGLTYTYKYDEVGDVGNARVKFSEALLKGLAEGSYEVNFYAADMHGKEWNQTLAISISNAVVLTQDPVRSEIWAHRATIRGTLLKETSDAITFNYRKAGESQWSSIAAVMGSDNTFTAELTGLEAGTAYQYQAVGGTMASATIAEFTTEEVFVIPNAGFEDWQQSGRVWLIYGANDEMWWDSGNHGSATMNVNVTNYDSSIKHSGNYSIKMQSQFVGIMGIGKFAAGNVFSGSYVGTDGTNGILDFGRAISSRPTKLTGYYKYVTGEVNYSDNADMPVGATDKGNIYIAIGDWSSPVRITTKDKVFFNKNDENIIAFGEIIPDANTQGDGLVPFTIDLDYRSTDRIPTYIVIVASASYYGDYFTGSTSSTMWLDDLELVYE